MIAAFDWRGSDGVATGEPTVEEELAKARQHFGAGEYEQAERICRQILRAHPNHPEALNQLAETTHHAGAPVVALALARRAVSLVPDNAVFLLTLGLALHALGRSAEAEGTLRRALDLSPDSRPILAGLVSALIALGRLAEAHELVENALARKTDEALLYQMRGVVLWWLARPAEARASFNQAGELAPGFFQAQSGALFARHYVDAADAEAVTAEARAWGAKHADQLTRAGEIHRNQPDPNRRLRVGYVSGDFRNHPVGRILQSVLPLHDPSQVEVYCYSNHWTMDEVTRQLRAGAAVWRSVLHLNDAALADLIRADAIDVLVDLSGHTAEGRLLALARKPAPVQAMWLGYFDTTGMSAVDYVIADRHVCPSGDERFYVEKVARLPNSFLCFTPPVAGPEVAPLPAFTRGQVTFGCLNNLSKVTPEVLALWARILHAIPNARLFLKAVALRDPSVRERCIAAFGELGIESDRLEVVGSSPYLEYLRSYGEIDVALDPFPYNGGHTTLDALWMGVPVVALRGQRFVSRMGASILSTLGLGELVAESVDEYVEKAVALGQDVERLAGLRAGLRDRMAASPLCDGAGVARGLERIYRECWQEWCRSSGPTGRKA